MDNENKNKKPLLAIIITLVGSVALFVISMIVLPKDIHLLPSNESTFYKVPILIIPFAITLFFFVLYLREKNEEVLKKRLFGSLSGVILQIAVLIINL